VISWIAPANYSEGQFLPPSVVYSQRRWQWHPSIVVADMGYIDAATKRYLREVFGIAVVTRLKEGMRLVPPFESDQQAACEQGQVL